MFRFSKKSLDMLSNKVNPQLQDLMNRIIKVSKIDIGIIAGFRTAEEQNYIYNSQASKCDGYIKKSKHQDGNAIDFICYDNKDNKITYNIKYYYYIVGLAEQIARELNIKINCGIWWSFEDGGHIEVVDS